MTLWGQSAGASSVDIYDFAYPVEPIVKGVIMDSGSASLLSSRDSNHTNFTSMARVLGCGNQAAADELACMRNIPMDTIIQAFTAALSTGINFVPVVDEKIVFSNYTQRALDKQIAKIVCSLKPFLILDYANSFEAEHNRFKQGRRWSLTYPGIADL